MRQFTLQVIGDLAVRDCLRGLSLNKELSVALATRGTNRESIAKPNTPESAVLAVHTGIRADAAYAVVGSAVADKLLADVENKLPKIKF